MDILESVLRTSKAEDYLDVFRKVGVDASVLPILSDGDLILLGISDNEIRDNILKQSSKLQIPAERKIDYTVKKEYFQLLLNQILSQLNLHKANLACALRDDVVVCDIKLYKATKCLQSCLRTFQNKLEFLHSKLQVEVQPVERKRKKGKWIKIISAVSAAFIIAFVGLRPIK